MQLLDDALDLSQLDLSSRRDLFTLPQPQSIYGSRSQISCVIIFYEIFLQQDAGNCLALHEGVIINRESSSSFFPQ